MNRFSRTEFQLINYLYNREMGLEATAMLLNTELGLQEKDEISKIREVVFYIEKLEREGILETDPDFYTESDHMSFTYLNSAVELDEDKVRLSDEGRRQMGDYLRSSGGGRFFTAYTHIMNAPETKCVLQTLCALALLVGGVLGFVAGRSF